MDPDPTKTAVRRQRGGRSDGSARHLGRSDVEQGIRLMCPVNRIGTVDLFCGFGIMASRSRSEVLVHAIHPASTF